MESTAARLPRPSASGIERTLAALLVGLLGLYAVGTILSDLAPAVDTAGVIAVHLAVVVGGVFPFAVLGHAVYSRFRPEATGPRLLEVGTALVAVTSLAAALWLALQILLRRSIRRCSLPQPARLSFSSVSWPDDRSVVLPSVPIPSVSLKQLLSTHWIPGTLSRILNPEPLPNQIYEV